MPSDFVISDVTSEAMMTVTKLVSIAPTALSLNHIAKGVQDRFKESHTRLIITACIQLKLLHEKDNSYIVNPKYQDSIKRANKNELSFLFRQALQDYPPFLLYADLLSKDYSSANAVNMVRGALQINSPANVVEKALRNWGITAKLIIIQNGVLRIPDAEKGLPSNYVQDLLKALDSEFHAKMFLINTFGQEVYVCLTTLGLDISDLAKSLIEYESDSKNSLDRSGQFFENYLIQFGTSIGIKVIGKNGVNAAIDEFFNQKKILKNQKYIANGAGGARNIGAHAVDSETGKAWAVTPQASLAITLLVPVMMRSIYLHIKNNQQVF